MSSSMKSDIIRVTSLWEAIRRLVSAIGDLRDAAKNAGEQTIPDSNIFSESITFPLEDLPDFRDHVGHTCDIKDRVALQREICLAIRGPLNEPSILSSASSVSRTIHVRDDLVTIKLKVEYSK